MKFRQDHLFPQSHGMNLVPLIDVLLILLIFFIVTFGWAKFETEVEISVPSSDSGAPASRKVGELVVNVRQDGTTVVNGNVVTSEQLHKKFLEIAKFNRKQAIIIRADEESRYRSMFDVLDMCHKAGLYHVSFASRAKREGE